MSYQYITTDTSGLREFIGLGTGREVLVNADPEGRIVLLHEPSTEEVINAIKEYNSKRIAYWWDNIIAVVRTERGAAGSKSQADRFVNGFKLNSFIEPGKKRYTFQFLKPSLLRSHLSGLTDMHYVDYCLGLSLDEQLALLNTLRPANVDELLRTVPLRIIPRALEFDFLKCFQLCGEFTLFINRLMELLTKFDDYGNFAKEIRLGWGAKLSNARVLELLGYLNQKKWMLLNKKAMLEICYASGGRSNFNMSSTLGEPAYWNNESVALAKVVIDEYEQGRYRNPSDPGRAYMRLCLLLRSTSVEDIGDFSPELLTYNESHLEPGNSSAEGRAIVRQLTDATIRSYRKDQRYIAIDFPIIKRTPIGRQDKKTPVELLRSSGVRWVLEDHPEFITWVEVFEEYAEKVKSQHANHLFWGLNHWLDYLLLLESPPLRPEEVNRQQHIRNVWNQSVKTYWAHLNTSQLQTHSKNRALLCMRHFFNYYADILIVVSQGHPAAAPQLLNPVREDDRWNYKNQRKTQRFALGADLLDLLQEILLDRDQDGTPTYNWAKTHPSLRNDWVCEVDPESLETVKVWWPGRTVSIYVLLCMPLRSIQVRWLDEGIGDEYVYDWNKQCMVPNTHPSAEAGRRESVFRLLEDPFHGASFLGLWVNTNKTQQYDPTVERGYEIPWPNEELFSVLRTMMDWNQKFFPNPKPVTLADDHETVTTKAVRPLLPKFYPLFRDRSGHIRRNPNLPIRYEKLVKMWGLLLAEAEKRLKERGHTVELVEWVHGISDGKYPYKYPRAKYDLHSVRVSGITSLLEKGVPIHIVSEYIAGHSTIIMTLHYEKTSPSRVREILLQAQAQAKAELDGFVPLLEQLIDPESVLVWNNFNGPDNSAIRALNANKGLWQIGSDGVCPGTLCEEGGPLDAWGKATSIPNGACGQCRFFITGPQFLYGQMQKLNHLMYVMREKGEELRRLREKEMDVEDDGDNRLLSKTRGRRERIERELKDTTYEWCNRFRMFQTSLAMLDEYQKKKSDKSLMPLLSPNSEEGFKAVVSEASNVALVRQISLMHEILGDFDLRKGPLLEYEEILNTILVDNGFEAFLLTIPREKRTAAATMLGEFWINSIGDDDALDNLSSGRESFPKELHEPTRTLMEYLKSDKFVITPPADNPENKVRQSFVQIKGLRA